MCVSAVCGWLVTVCAGRLSGNPKRLNSFFLLFTTAVFTGLYVKFGFTPGYLIGGIFSACLITAGIVDLRIHILPNIINAAGIAAAFVISAITAAMTSSAGPLRDWLSGIAACGVPVLIVAVASRRGMGMGDVKFAALIGAFLGVSGGLCALWLAIVAGGIFGVILIASGKATRKTPIPFGPFMAGAALAMLFFGDQAKAFIAEAYRV